MTHPDLVGQVVADKNFSASPDTTDTYGHGTHVASIVAGTGKKSKGRYKGVAPGAKLLNGKALGDDGSGDDSGIIAGMEWAAEQGADVVNLSLGGPDTPAVDPMEAEIDKLSTEKGILFAVAAGNDGEWGDRTIGSPGSAATALNAGVVVDPDDSSKRTDWLARPKLTVDRKVSLTLDARTARPVSVTVPEAGAEPVFAAPEFTLRAGEGGYTFGWLLDSTAPTRRKIGIPVTVRGPAAGSNLKSLAVYVSDDGKKWVKVDVDDGRFTYGVPAAGKSVSLRAEVTDQKGDKGTVSIYDAYVGR